METKITTLLVGVLFIIIALLLGGVQLLHIYNFYGGGQNKWYFYGLVGVIGLAGIAIAVWSLMKKTSEQTKP